MPSNVAWIDYDSEANQRAQRILTLFREKDTRDELGFGADIAETVISLHE